MGYLNPCTKDLPKSVSFQPRYTSKNLESNLLYKNKLKSFKTNLIITPLLISYTS